MLCRTGCFYPAELGNLLGSLLRGVLAVGEAGGDLLTGA
jgi:hypothetical protein